MSGMFKRKNSLSSKDKKEFKSKRDLKDGKKERASTKSFRRNSRSNPKIKHVPVTKTVPEIEGIKNVALKKVNATLSRSIVSHVIPHVSDESQTGTTTVSVEGCSCVVKNSVSFCPVKMKPDSSISITLFSADLCNLLDLDKHSFIAQIVDEKTHKVKTVPAQIMIDDKGRYIYKLVFKNKYNEDAYMKAIHVASRFTKGNIDDGRNYLHQDYKISLEATISCAL